MKKILLIAIAVFGVALFSACDNVEYEPIMSYKYVTVDTADWEHYTYEHGWNGYLQCDVPVSIITKRVCRSGAVMVYLVNGDLQELVLSVIWIDDNKGHIFGQAISCAFSPGWIRFYYNRDDFTYPNNLPNEMTFRIVTLE